MPLCSGEMIKELSIILFTRMAEEAILWQKDVQ